MASRFEILAAIDLRGGRVVRLRQGDFARETVFSDDPAEVARRFASAGARWLHVVDLDGARAGAPAQDEVVSAIVAAVGGRVAVEVAGGLRSVSSVERALSIGAARVVIGTAALDDPAFAGLLVRTHGTERIVVAIDVRQGIAVGHGWVADDGGVDAEAAVRALVDEGVRSFEVTAIDRDGMLSGPDVGLYRRLVAIDGAEIIASAGIASIDDLEAVRSLGCRGAIIGRALYDGSLDLREAIDAVQ